MTPEELQRYLHDHIPLSKAMQAAVVDISADTVELRAPLEPNINHRATAFGGSVSTLAVLAAWSLLHTRLRAAGVFGRLVIQRNSMEYTRPIAAAFAARAILKSPDSWEGFLRVLGRKGKARITVLADVQSENVQAGRFEGEFVALRVDA